jgi:predicted ATPase
MFKLLRAFIEGNLNKYVTDNGGAGDLLFCGRKITKEIEVMAKFGIRGYKFNLVPTPRNMFRIENEARYYEPGYTGWWELGDNEEGKSKMAIEVLEDYPDKKFSLPVYEAINSWQIYHFHDTSSTSGMRHYEIVQDNNRLRQDAANIAPFLLMLQQKHIDVYKKILHAVQLVTPFFQNFALESRVTGNKEEVNLSWNQVGSDYPMQPYHLSDGTIRFICLATALLQPNPPSTIIIDEPELGLHPAAIVILGELIQVAAHRTQVIVATQSPQLIDQFSIDDIIVVNRENGASTFKRLREENFSTWLEDYSVGELWTKNVILGGPDYE